MIYLLFFSLFAVTSYELEEIYQYDQVVWGFDFLSKKEALVNLKNGEIHHLNITTKKSKKIFQVKNLNDDNQGGLLDIVLDPDFNKNAFVYISYSYKTDKGNTTAVARMKYQNSKLNEFQNIFIAKPFFSTEHHYGSRLVFDDKGFLFVSVGDRGKRDLAQSLKTDNGKIHRLKTNGTIPKDNPFYNHKEASKSIWSYGHRNPQGMYFDKKTKTLWEQEHGPRGGDEINQISKGKNYGWPIITYGREYYGPKIGKTHKKGMEQPFYHFTPSIAPSGFAVYRGEKFKNWQGDFLSGALKLTHLNVLDHKTKKEMRLFKEKKERIRNVKVYKGDIYLSTDSGKLLKIK